MELLKSENDRSAYEETGICWENLGGHGDNAGYCRIDASPGTFGADHVVSFRRQLILDFVHLLDFRDPCIWSGFPDPWKDFSYCRQWKSLPFSGLLHTVVTYNINRLTLTSMVLFEVIVEIFVCLYCKSMDTMCPSSSSSEFWLWTKKMWSI